MIFELASRTFLTALDKENWQKLEADQIKYSLCTLTAEIYDSNVSMLRLETKAADSFFIWSVFTFQNKQWKCPNNLQQ